MLASKVAVSNSSDSVPVALYMLNALKQLVGELDHSS